MVPALYDVPQMALARASWLETLRSGCVDLDRTNRPAVEAGRRRLWAVEIYRDWFIAHQQVTP